MLRRASAVLLRCLQFSAAAHWLFQFFNGSLCYISTKDSVNVHVCLLALELNLVYLTQGKENLEVHMSHFEFEFNLKAVH